MPSRANPNTPSKSRPKAASVLKSKRKHLRHLSSIGSKGKVDKRTIPRTSQALRQSAPLSRKKARKLEKKEGYTRKRKELEKYLEAEVEMRDLDGEKAAKEKNAETGNGDGGMEVD